MVTLYIIITKRGKMVTFILITLFSLFFSSNCTKISVSLMPGRSFCFNQDMPRHSLMTLDVASGDQPFRVQIMYLRTLMENITSTANLTKSFTTQKFGSYRICLFNEAPQYNTLIFQFLTGIHAKDYTSHSESSDYVASIDNQANIAQLFVNQIRQQNKEGLQIMQQDEALFKQYSIEYFFTAIFVGITMFLSYVQYSVIKSHMETRKYI